MYLLQNTTLNRTVFLFENEQSYFVFNFYIRTLLNAYNVRNNENDIYKIHTGILRLQCDETR